MDSEPSRMAVAILIPTLNRTHLIKPLIENIRAVTPQPHKIYFTTQNPESRKIIRDMKAVLIEDEVSTDYVTRMNVMYHATDEPYVFTGSDDVVFHEGWLEPLLQAQQEGYFVAVPNDLLNPNGTQALISRKYIEEQSGCVDVPNVLFYPGYKHDFAETEQFETAKHRGVFKKCEDSVVEHMHWANGKAPHDDDYKLKESLSHTAMELYQSRVHLWT